MSAPTFLALSAEASARKSGDASADEASCTGCDPPQTFSKSFRQFCLSRPDAVGFEIVTMVIYITPVGI